MKRWIGGGLLAIMVAGCTAPRPAAVPSLPSPTSVPDLAAAIAAAAERSDREPNAAIRGELAEAAARDADACLAREPQAAACLYGRALALGLGARAHPTRAGPLLTDMLEYLARAEAADPHYEHAGPARVRAQVLTRAPGWPIGPGDPDAALTAARRAAALEPEYPPNLLALAQVLAKSGDSNGARDAFARARGLAQSLPATADRDGWLREADEALRNH